MPEPFTLPAFPVEGGCQCGAVRYRVLAKPLGVYRCHCKDCQRFSGTGYSMSMVLHKADLQRLDGELVAYRKTADSGRVALMHACTVCGTKLWNEPLSSPDLLMLKPGTLDDASWAVPVGDIWIKSKVPWVEVAGEAPSYPEQPASRQALYDAWAELAEEHA